MRRFIMFGGKWRKKLLGYRLNEAYCWIRNALFARYDRLKLEKVSWGAYVDPCWMLFELNFQLLKDFVEIELASLEFSANREEYSWSYRMKWNWLPLKFTRSMGREMGLKHLEWEISLTNEKMCDGHHDWYSEKDESFWQELSPQAQKALKQKELYLWYTDVYPKRIDPIELFDDESYANSHTISRDERGWVTMTANTDTPEYQKYIDESNAYQKEEERQFNEDTQKLKELIDIRASLWT